MTIAIAFFTYSFVALSILALTTKLTTKLTEFILKIYSIRKSICEQVLMRIRMHKWEYFAVSLQFFTLLTSFFTRNKFIKSDIAATFLSIYATIFAVNVALWALFSGVLDKSYMGISYTEYFFSMKPQVYKQKWVVLASLFVLLVSCLCYLLGIYDFVGAALLFEIISIAASTMFLYYIFKSPREIKSEIRQYSIKKQFEVENKDADTGYIEDTEIDYAKNNENENNEDVCKRESKESKESRE